MAKSVSEKLNEIRQRRERAKKQLENADQQLEQLITPTKRKIVKIVEDTTDQFIRDNLDSLEAFNVDKENIREETASMLRSVLLGGVSKGSSRSNNGEGSDGEADSTDDGGRSEKTGERAYGQDRAADEEGAQTAVERGDELVDDGNGR